MKKIFLIILCLGFLSACGSPDQTNSSQSTAIPTTTAEVTPTHQPTPSEPTATPRDPEAEVLARAAQVVLLLKEQDMAGLAEVTHRNIGIRFSPYAFVRPEDQIFLKAQIAGLMGDTTVYHWGIYDGSGMDIDLTFADYFADFVYDVDFANAPQVAVNQRLGMGNSIDNSAEVYPGNSIVEYHFPGFDPQYEGMDWRSLRLVFKYCQGSYDLVGIIHDEWTP